MARIVPMLIMPVLDIGWVHMQQGSFYLTKKPLAGLSVDSTRHFSTHKKLLKKGGQYKDGTVFIEGLVYFKKKWYFYHGCADSMVGVAIYNPS